MGYIAVSFILQTQGVRWPIFFSLSQQGLRNHTLVNILQMTHCRHRKDVPPYGPDLLNILAIPRGMGAVRGLPRTTPDGETQWLHHLNHHRVPKVGRQTMAECPRAQIRDAHGLPYDGRSVRKCAQHR